VLILDLVPILFFDWPVVEVLGADVEPIGWVGFIGPLTIVTVLVPSGFGTGSREEPTVCELEEVSSVVLLLSPKLMSRKKGNEYC
jgi:hypothetical protein